jgi:LAO/AO transport system kinase
VAGTSTKGKGRRVRTKRSALAAGVAKGDSLSVARAITLVEDRSEAGATLMSELSGNIGSAHRVGITGPPGAGKSTLVNALARLLLEPKKSSVGIIAVDPTSPFTGGALLGDRVRMQGAAGDKRVFIRSMASRGDLGGLAAAAQDGCDVLDAAGKKWVLLETVGVGQTEVEVAGAADTVVVILHPESGDGVQAMKAGLMEVADIYVVNKSDREGADRLVREVLETLELRRPDETGWKPPVVQTVATSAKGLDELADAIDEHGRHAKKSGSWETRRRTRARTRIHQLVEDAIRARVLTGRAEELEGLVDRVVSGKDTPGSAAENLLRSLVER